MDNDNKKDGNIKQVSLEEEMEDYVGKNVKETSIKTREIIDPTLRETRKTIWIVFCGLTILGALGISIYHIIYNTVDSKIAWGLLGTLLGIVLKDISKLFE